MSEVQRRVDELRSRAGDVENHLIDELRAGKIDRREFMRRGSMVGVSLPLLGFIAAGCGVSREDVERTDKPQTGKPQPGGVIRMGLIQPGSAIEPVIVNNQGGLVVLGQTGEYLVWSDRELNTIPRLAESWKPSEGGQVWEFKIRQGVKFHDGRPMTTEDVAASIDRLADPDNGSNALSAFAGVISKGGSKAVDDTTVRFELDAANGNFPNLLSSDNYNAIIVPRDYDGDWEKTFIGTGPWKLDRYQQQQRVSMVRNEEYWDPSRRALADRAEIVFYPDEQSQVLGFQGNEVDVLVQYSVSGGKALLTDPSVITTELRASSHRQIHMRTDKEPFTDKRVRQAMALLINRDALVDGLLDTKSDFGNDSPFAPVFKSTAKVEQRQRDIAKAKQLLEAAGKPNGFTVKLETWNGFEMPDLAQLIQQDVRPGGINVQISVTDSATYYGDAVFGNSRWLDSTMGITEYGHRGVPNVLLGAPLQSKGTWNGAHFKNDRYDKLVRDYTAAVDLDVQRDSSRQIQELLLDESPIMFTYFYYFLSGAKDYIAGVETNAMGHTDVSRAGQLEA
jgi:peptide/nickel transport system substrate-binding protein